MKKPEIAPYIREELLPKGMMLKVVQVMAAGQIPESNFYDLYIRCAMRHQTACGAKCRKLLAWCQQPAMANGRCRFHGGKSTGPKTKAGKQRAASANLRHGEYTEGIQQSKGTMSQLMQDWKTLSEKMGT